MYSPCQSVGGALPDRLPAGTAGRNRAHAWRMRPVEGVKFNLQTVCTNVKRRLSLAPSGWLQEKPFQSLRTGPGRDLSLH